MLRPLSLALRLTIYLSITIIVVFSSFGWLLNKSIENHLRNEDIAELEIISDSATQALTDSSSTDSSDQFKQRIKDILVGHHRASMLIATKEGSIIFGSRHENLAGLMEQSNLHNQKAFLWTDNTYPYRVLIRKIERETADNENSLFLITAVPTDSHQHFLEKFNRTLWLMISASILIMGVMGYIVVIQGHAPLREIVSRIRRISADKLNIRLQPEKMPAELTNLAVSFNEMLERVDSAFQHLSDFNADIAHELRTPITNMMTQTQVALSRTRTLDEYREILYSNMEEYERLSQMVNDMLFLAQTDNGLPLGQVARINIHDELRALIDFYDPWAEESKVSIHLSGVGMMDGSRQMLQRAFSNLLSNAIRHTPANGYISVNIHERTNIVQIVIENTGEAIPPEHIKKIFNRFYRADTSRQRLDSGVGLGLAIVKSIVEAHKGKITVESFDGKTKFTLIFPSTNSY